MEPSHGVDSERGEIEVDRLYPELAHGAQVVNDLGVAAGEQEPLAVVGLRRRRGSVAMDPIGERDACRIAAEVDGQRPRNPSPSRTWAESDRPKTPSSGQLGSRVGKFELGARLETMTKAARQDMRARRRWLRDQSRSRPDVVARARIVVHA